MAVYRVQENGKAQSGLKKGDEVVTAGGTYKITGVNSDGSYKSEKVNNTTTSTYTGTYANSGGGSSKPSQYTGSSTGVKTYSSSQKDIKDQMNANSIAWWSADETERKRLEAENQRLASRLGGSVSYDATTGTWGGNAAWEQEERPEEYESKYDPQIDAILNEILNREDFSYNVMNDPLYQQYANMYRREGDRAMKETLAEAAAGAGGMNTYAITAAQQANSYYNSQLNDKIPELYQLAYEMYLQDKESKVQDLGILQNMDATQYARYRDTMTDWKDDRNFAYGIYQDDVTQGNWQTTFDNNNYWKNKEFDNNEYWKNKEWDYNDMWANKEWDEAESDEAYERNQAEVESAKAEIEWYIKNGVTSIPSDLIAKSGLDQTAINQMIAYYKQQQTPSVSSSGGGDDSGYTPKKTDEKKKVEDDGYTGDDTPKVDEKDEAYERVIARCDELVASGDIWAAAACFTEGYTKGIIPKEDYLALRPKYNPMLNIFVPEPTTNPFSSIGGK